MTGLLSYVVPVMNRSKYAVKTVANNLPIVERHGAKLLVVAYGDGEGIADYLSQHHWNELDRGLLTVYEYSGNAYYQRSHSANLAWLAADTKYVVDIAAETMIHDAGAAELQSLIAEHDGKHPNDRWCCYPFQIMTTQDLFLRLGGFDETFLGWGYEDADFENRARAAAVEIPMANGPKKWTHIKNTTRTAAFPPLFKDHKGTHETNRRRAKLRPVKNRANFRQLWGHGLLTARGPWSHRLRLGAYTNQQQAVLFKRREYILPDHVVGAYEAVHPLWKGDVEILSNGRFKLGAESRGDWVYNHGCLTLMWEDGCDDESLYHTSQTRIESLDSRFTLTRRQ